MYMTTTHYQNQLWDKHYPAIIGALLSVIEMILTAAVVGCEIGGIFFHFYRMNAFVGFWALPFYTCAWVTLGATSCCCRVHCGGSTALFFQCLAFLISLCVIGFDAYFLTYPTQCFFSSCNSYIYTYSYGYSNQTYDSSGLLNTATLYNIKVPLVRGQLAAAVLMFVSCIIYIFIFAITKHRVSKDTQFQEPMPPPMHLTGGINTFGVTPITVFPQPYGPPPMILPNTPQIVPLPVPVPVPEPVPNPTLKNQLICSTCRSRFTVARQQN